MWKLEGMISKFLNSRVLLIQTPVSHFDNIYISSLSFPRHTPLSTHVNTSRILKEGRIIYDHFQGFQ